MCVVKTFREDRTLVAAADYIGDALGQRFVESVPLSMERAWAESHKKCPLICLLSPGERLAVVSPPLATKIERRASTWPACHALYWNFNVQPKGPCCLP